MSTTIIYLTDNSLDKDLTKLCQKSLLKSSDGLPIISVSQKPIKLGKNICVGDIGRSWMSLYKQLYVGLKTARTKDVAIAEHDCLYPAEHFKWKPPQEDTFYYNKNQWLLQHVGRYPEMDGMYSYWPRRYALSQLICNRKHFLQEITELMELLGEDIDKFEIHIEPGLTNNVKMTRARRIAMSGKPSYLKQYIKAHLDKYNKIKQFKTKIAIIDIRHKTNFTGPRRGGRRRWSLPYWGKMDELSKK